MTVLALVGGFFSQCVTAAESIQKVRIGYPSSAVSTLPFDIAKEKGFYSKAGLDVEYIQMRTAIAPQAILNGNINFFTSPQSGISAAASGLPLVRTAVASARGSCMRSDRRRARGSAATRSTPA